VKLLLLVNPVAAKVSAPARHDAEQALGEGHELTVVETLYRGHAIDLAREAASSGTKVVIVLGGDGTLNEAANGLVGTDTALAALPGGSTNVFTRAVGGAKRLDPALRQVRAGLDRPPRRIGLGLVNGRYFLFHVGMGFDAAVVGQVEKRPKLKRTLGQGIFVYAAFATWFRHYDRKRPRMAVEVDGARVVDDGYFAVCLNTNPYTYLGVRPLNLAPDASLDTPLAVVTLRTLKFGTTLSLVGSALGKGRRLRTHKRVDYRTDLPALDVVGHGPFPYQADGDYLGEAERLSITHERDRLLMVLPQ
jgi:diacylglycerol kinase family enzyme